jgi:hypothetical protein
MDDIDDAGDRLWDDDHVDETYELTELSAE